MNRRAICCACGQEFELAPDPGTVHQTHCVCGGLLREVNYQGVPDLVKEIFWTVAILGALWLAYQAWLSWR